MRHFASKSSLTALIVVTVVVFSGIAPGSEDFLPRAAAQFREKSYSDSFDLARKSEPSPKRSFLMGVNALRLGKAEEAVPLLVEAEQKLPLLGDYAALYQAEALLKLKKYNEAAVKAAAIPKVYPASLLIRRAEKLHLDILIASADYKNAIKSGQAFVEKYPSGGDSVDALFQSARSCEEAGDQNGAAQIYRGICLNNPLSSQAKISRERLQVLEKGGVGIVPFTAEELLRLASTLYSRNEFTLSLQTLKSIPLAGQPEAVVGRIDLRTGLALYRLRNWNGAEKSLEKAAGSTIAAIRSEARFWHAKSLERQDRNEQAFKLYLELTAEGSKQEFADDALMEAAGLRRIEGHYAEAARLFEQVGQSFPGSRFIPRASWDSSWCHYLAGENALAAESFKVLLKDEAQREKTLYWIGRALEKAGNVAATDYYRILLDEFPSGFYASWYREQKGIKDTRETLDRRDVLIDAALPSGFDKPRLLSSLGMIEEARSEMAAARRKTGDRKGQFPGLARIYLEMGDYGSAIALFLQNFPVKWEKATLPLWTAGYPLAYSGPVAEHTAANNLSEALIYSLIRAESGFCTTITSPVGAMGLMQLMPATAKATAREKGAFNPARLMTPEYNIRLGTKHFRDLLKGYDGDLVYSVAAYNAGSGSVARWRKNLKGLSKDEFIESIPYQETRDYVKKVYAAAATYRQLYGLR